MFYCQKTGKHLQGTLLFQDAVFTIQGITWKRQPLLVLPGTHVTLYWQHN